MLNVRSRSGTHWQAGAGKLIFVASAVTELRVGFSSVPGFAAGFDVTAKRP